ncbi:3-oxoacyl-ACP synthase [Mucilaginibacter sp. McL0603]|uniref:3-oxoacyl-ACP synthase n=1 Tax=Mucilaginibacter sp. McL0603 TaxID=3415670 RepID=UPI003CF1A8AD
MNDIKRELYGLCIAYVKQRIDTAKQAINDAQQAAGEETKSSAGDKYETSREMIQQVTDRSQAQLNEANKLLIALNQINVDTVYETAVPGSLITTNNGRFYIAISAGALILNGDTYFAVSMASPIGLSLRGQKAGDQFSLNGKQYLIENIT